jgi:hypothetical protein
MALRSDPPGVSFASLPGRVVAALELLLDARRYAVDLGVPVAEFAIGLNALQHRELAEIDVRWLLAKGYVNVVDTDEISRSGQMTRIETVDSVAFVITEQGAAYAARELYGTNGIAAEISVLRPVWDLSRRELRVGRSVVKQYRVPAPNQELVLACFEEEGWPPQITDPLPPVMDLESKRRLHDTINALNRCQSSPGIRFQGDGTGCGVRWDCRLGAAN